MQKPKNRPINHKEHKAKRLGIAFPKKKVTQTAISSLIDYDRIAQLRRAEPDAPYQPPVAVMANKGSQDNCVPMTVKRFEIPQKNRQAIFTFRKNTPDSMTHTSPPLLVFETL